MTDALKAAREVLAQWDADECVDLPVWARLNKLAEALRTAFAEVNRQKYFVELATDHCKRQDAEVDRLTAERERLQAQYDELIFAVATKFEGETRHQTALRYIRSAEIRICGEGQESREP